MLKGFSDDVSVLGGFFLRTLRGFFHSLKKHFKGPLAVLMEKSKKGSSVLLEPHGALRLGGVLLGERVVDGHSVFIYKISKLVEAGRVKCPPLYIAYALNRSRNWITVIEQDWDSVIKAVSLAIEKKQPLHVSIDFKKKGGLNFGEKQGKFGRRKI